MSEEKQPIRNAALARHAGVSPAYITKLKKPVAEGGKAMPDFDSLSDFDAWRTVNAPPLRKRLEIGQKNGGQNSTTTSLLQTTTAAGRHDDECSAANNRSASNVIDVTRFIVPGADFDALMIRQAEGVPQVAYGLYERACQGGNPNEIAAALKNWTGAAEGAAEVRAKFHELQEKTGAVISLDLVMDVVGTELQAAYSMLKKLGERAAASANPADPALAKTVIDAGVDEIFQKLFVAVEALPTTMAPKAAAAS